MLGHLLIFKSGERKLTEGSGLRFFTGGCSGQKFGLETSSVNIFGSFLLVQSGSPEKSILISCQNHMVFAASTLKLRKRKRLGHPKPSQVPPVEVPSILPSLEVIKSLVLCQDGGRNLGI